MRRGLHALLWLSAARGHYLDRPYNPQGRIVGGTTTNIASYPYQVSVQRQGKHICGGSIIHPLYILTAAHCLYLNGTYSVRVGSSLHGGGGALVGVARTRLHRRYVWTLHDYDVALLRLAAPLRFSARVQPVALARAGERLPSGTRATALGWGSLLESSGYSNVLQKVDIPLLTRKDCRKYYRYRITSRMICSGFQEGGRDACQGDSGGPLLAAGRQVGIVSGGRGCARPAAPGIFTSVAAVRRWIAAHAGV